jgi:hypothetical protein
MLSRLVVSAAVPLIAVAALAGCTPPGPVGPPTSGEDLPDETPTAEALSLEPPKCLIGDWYISQDQLQVFYDSVSDATDGAVSFIAEGDTGLSFDGTQFEYTPDLRLDISTPATEGQATIAGSISGGYEADATTVTTSNETVDVDYEYIVGGVAQDASLLFGEALLGSPINGGEYTCTPDGPIISFDNGFGRVPVQLVPLP